MKNLALTGLLVLALILLGGCSSVQAALGKLGDELEASYIQEAKPGSGDGIDWSYVPVVREMAIGTFTQGFPEAEVVETSVASRNGAGDRVIVTITYRLNGQSGAYGFDYARNEQGEYELTRYGDGVGSGDL